MACPFDEDDGADCVSSDCEDADGADVQRWLRLRFA